MSTFPKTESGFKEAISVDVYQVIVHSVFSCTCMKYVETAKPLIPRRHPKQPPSTQSDVFVATKNETQHEIKNDKSLKSVDSVEKDEVRGDAGDVNVQADSGSADDAKMPEAVEAALTDEDIMVKKKLKW